MEGREGVTVEGPRQPLVGGWAGEKGRLLWHRLDIAMQRSTPVGREGREEQLL